MTTRQFDELCKDIRKLCLDMAYKSGKGHLGGTFSIIETLVDLYYNVLTPSNSLLIGKGHAAPALYSILYKLGKLKYEDLSSFCEDGFWLGGQLDPNIPGVNYISGSLGNVLGIGAGIATANSKNRVYVIVGDGECEEGSIWESADYITKKQLTNLTLIVDKNCLSVTDFIENDNLASKFQAFGWQVKEINGHLPLPMSSNLSIAYNPIVFIADTVKGKGVSFIENSPEWHNRALTEDEYQKAIKELC